MTRIRLMDKDVPPDRSRRARAWESSSSQRCEHHSRSFAERFLGIAHYQTKKRGSSSQRCYSWDRSDTRLGSREALQLPFKLLDLQFKLFNRTAPLLDRLTIYHM